MYDSLSALQAGHTVTATHTPATGFDLNKRTPEHGLTARILYSDAANASGSNTVSFKIQHSDEAAANFADVTLATDAITLNTEAKSGEIFIPFITSKRYIRLVATVAGAGGSPSITYSGELGISQP